MHSGYVALAALLIFLPGCRYYGGFWGNQRISGKDAGPFAVSSVLPAPAATAVPTNSGITLTFNRTMSVGTVSAQTTSGACTGSVQLSTDSFSTCIGVSSQTWNTDNSSLTLVPGSALAASTLHKLRILASVSATTGELLVADYNSTFTTGAGSDTTPPSTPATPAATPISQTQIDLTWSAATDDTTPQVSLVYNICRSTTPGGCSAFTTLATTSAGALNYSDTGLSPLTTYYYRVQAQDLAANASTATAEFSATTLAAGSVATPTFSPIAGTYGGTQNVAVSTTTGGATICFTTNGTDPTCLLGACTTGTTYAGSIAIAADSTLKAMACLNGYTDSAINAGNYVIDTTPPGVPGGAAATPISLSQLDLSWTAATDNVSIASAIAYEICMSTSAGGCTAFTATATTAPGATTYSATGLSALTTYYFRIRAKDGVGNLGTATTEFSATTLSSGSVATPTFSPIAGTYGTAQNVTITSATGGATICYTTNGVDPGCSLGICSGSTTYGAPVAVSADTTLKAIGCAVGYSNSAVQTGAYVIDMTPPTTPGTPAASPVGTTQISVTWSMSSDNTTPTGSIVYEVCQSTSAGGCSAFSVTATTGPGATGHSASGLTPGTTYYFSVRARDQWGNTSVETAEFSATTQLMPQVVSVNPGDGAGSVPVNTVIVINFNKTINTGTATAQTGPGACTDSLQISSDGFATCVGITSIGWDGSQMSATLSPAGPLSFATTYRIRVSTAVFDTFGNSLPSVFTTTTGFTTQPPGPGALDATFNPGSGADGYISSLQMIAGNNILISGWFSMYNGQPAGNILTLDPSGLRNGTWTSNGATGGEVTVARMDSGSTIYAAGGFTQYDGVARSTMASALSTGMLDMTLDPGTGFNGIISAMEIDGSGWIVVAGGFTNYNGTARSRLARLNTDGSLYATFDPGIGPDNDVLCMVVQSDNKLVIGGAFGNYAGTARARVARVNTDGTLDATFSPGTGADFAVNAMAIQPDGKVLIGGAFTAYNGTPRSRIARLNTDGTLDVSFAPTIGPDNAVRAIAIQADGKILIGGDFSAVDGTPRNRLARLNSTGALDSVFDPGPGANAGIRAIAVQADGKIVIGGDFTTYGGQPRNHIARILQ